MMDYKKLGLKCGIEIHQRLDTKKLFCDCSTAMKEEPSGCITRKLRPSSGEMGIIDPAALYEYLKDRIFSYYIYKNENCLVEMDEEPPHNVNKEALETSLSVCKMLNCSVPDGIQVMRKTVIDGSNTSGFQRTMIVGMEGEIKTSFGKVKIPTICLEEESARREKQEGNNIFYRLNGLGIPLIEIATDASLRTPDQCLETALKIGRFLRSFKIKRGIGTIRQDINVSIKKGARVEIKGFQDIKNTKKLIANEVKRQLALLEIKDKLKHIKWKMKKTEVTNLFQDTKCKFLKKIVDKGHPVYAFTLPFKGLMKKDVGGKRFGKELAYYAEAYGPKGIIHNEEDLEKYNLQKEFEKTAELLSPENHEIIAIVAGKGAEKAMKALKERTDRCFYGVPEETRIALNDNTTKYSRPLPGSERMYPETDIPSIDVSKYKIEKVETMEDKKKRLEKKMPKEMVNQIISSEYYQLFEEFLGYDPIIVATTLVSYMKDLRRKGKDVEKIGKKELDYIFKLVKNNKISKDTIPRALELVAEGEKLTEIEKRLGLMSKKEVEKIAGEIIKNNPGKKLPTLVGIMMNKTKGRVSGKMAAKLLHRKILNKEKGKE